MNSKQPTRSELKPTSAAEWRTLREQGTVVELPSGRRPVLIPVGIEELVRKGRIPNELLGLAAEVIWKNAPTTEHVRALGKSAVDFLNIVVQAAFKFPCVVIDEKPDDQLGEDEISIDDVDLMDKNAVFTYVTGPAAALRLFRAQQALDVGSVPARDENGAAAQPAP